MQNTTKSIAKMVYPSHAREAMERVRESLCDLSVGSKACLVFKKERMFVESQNMLEENMRDFALHIPVEDSSSHGNVIVSIVTMNAPHEGEVNVETYLTKAGILPIVGEGFTIRANPEKIGEMPVEFLCYMWSEGLTRLINDYVGIED